MTEDEVEQGIEYVYQELRDAVALALHDVLDPGRVQSVLITLDDAVGNNFDQLVLAFHRGAPTANS